MGVIIVIMLMVVIHGSHRGDDDYVHGMSSNIMVVDSICHHYHGGHE